MSRIRNALALFLFGLAARLADDNDPRLKITRVYTPTPAVEPENTNMVRVMSAHCVNAADYGLARRGPHSTHLFEIGDYVYSCPGTPEDQS